MSALQFVRCLLGKHHRDRKRTRHDDQGMLHSRCTGCGIALVKVNDRWGRE